MDHEKITRKMDNSLEVILHLQKLLDKIPVAERQALSRRIAQLSMDYLVNNIRLKHSLIALNHAIKKLRKHGLYPLPDKDYTKNHVQKDDRYLRRKNGAPLFHQEINKKNEDTINGRIQ